MILLRLPNVLRNVNAALTLKKDGKAASDSYYDSNMNIRF